MSLDSDNEVKSVTTASDVTNHSDVDIIRKTNDSLVSPSADQHDDTPIDEPKHEPDAHDSIAESGSDDAATTHGSDDTDDISGIDVPNAAGNDDMNENQDDKSDDSEDSPSTHNDADKQSSSDDSESINSDGNSSQDGGTADVPLLDASDDPIISLRDDVHAAYDDTRTGSHMPHAAKAAIGVIGTIACAAAVIAATMSFITVEIHPSIAGGESTVEKNPSIDGSGNKVNVTYDVKDALHSFSTDEAPILVWNDNWYSVDKDSEGKQAQSALASAGSGSTVHLSNGITIAVDGRYPCKSSGTAAGIDIDAISKLYGKSANWVAIRYDASHVLVGKRVDGGESTDSTNTNESDVTDTTDNINTDTDKSTSDSEDDTESGKESESEQISEESGEAAVE